MSKPTPIVAPRENVNDETVKIVSWLVSDGDLVRLGQSLVQIETSKAVLELEAPVAGTLRRVATEGEEISIGALIGHIHIDTDFVQHVDEAISSTVASNGSPVSIQAHEKTPAGGNASGTSFDHVPSGEEAGAQSQSPPARFSRKARELLDRQGLDAKTFNGHGLVRSKDLASPAAREQAKSTSGLPGEVSSFARTEPVAATGVAYRSERLPRTKRTEANYLRSAYDNTLMSTVTVSCPTRGFRTAAGEPAHSGATATAIILFEAARLLRKYPDFNAYCAHGSVHYYDDVNIGFAVDAGRGLKVPVIHHADRKGMGEIVAETRDLMIAYLENKLTLQALAGATFTVTDLSGEGVSAFHPLINQGQSAILGVCAEVFVPGSRLGTFNLILSFDHQLSDGRTAARFLNDLRERLGAYESVMRPKVESEVVQPRCARCHTSAIELRELDPSSHFLIQTVGADGSVRLICTICLLGN
jgi:2-oxoglutarate dehydrogenase E2 component (dihydrolipoamide succinyltransferase)